MIHALAKRWKQRRKAGQTSGRRRGPAFRRLAVEPIEQRVVLSAASTASLFSAMADFTPVRLTTPTVAVAPVETQAESRAMTARGADSTPAMTFVPVVVDRASPAWQRVAEMLSGAVAKFTAIERLDSLTPADNAAQPTLVWRTNMPVLSLGTAAGSLTVGAGTGVASSGQFVRTAITGGNPVTLQHSGGVVLDAFGGLPPWGVMRERFDVFRARPGEPAPGMGPEALPAVATTTARQVLNLPTGATVNDTLGTTASRPPALPLVAPAGPEAQLPGSGALLQATARMTLDPAAALLSEGGLIDLASSPGEAAQKSWDTAYERPAAISTDDAGAAEAATDEIDGQLDLPWQIARDSALEQRDGVVQRISMQADDEGGLIDVSAPAGPGESLAARTARGDRDADRSASGDVAEIDPADVAAAEGGRGKVQQFDVWQVLPPAETVLKCSFWSPAVAPSSTEPFAERGNAAEVSPAAADAVFAAPETQEFTAAAAEHGPPDQANSRVSTASVVAAALGLVAVRRYGQAEPRRIAVDDLNSRRRRD